MNSSLLDGFTVEGIERYNNTRQYSPSEERTLLLSLSDIWLSDSGTRQRAISDLRSGDLLYADETECRNAKGQTVLKFSNVFKKKLAAFISNGYSVVEAKVNFIVWWKGEDMDKEIRMSLCPSRDMPRQPLIYAPGGCQCGTPDLSLRLTAPSMVTEEWLFRMTRDRLLLW